MSSKDTKKANLDMNVWVTQQALADELNIPVQNVHNWVQRDKIKWVMLPGSTTKLVNRLTISIDAAKGRKQGGQKE